MSTPAPSAPSLTFIGTATTLIQYAGLTLLTDPNFLHKGQFAYLGYGLASRRRTEPAMQPADLPPLDAIVLSHLHGDHFDRIARRRLDRHTPVVTTPQAAEYLGRWGFAATGLPQWQSTVIAGPGDVRLRIEALPGRHARGPLGRLLPRVMGSLLEFRRGGEVLTRIYLTGDTLVGEHIADIARRHPAIDAAVVHLGGTRILGALVTMNGEQGVELLRLIRPGIAVPVHYDDYGVFRSPLDEFQASVERAGFAQSVHYVTRGETVPLTAPRLGSG